MIGSAIDAISNFVFGNPNYKFVYPESARKADEKVRERQEKAKIKVPARHNFSKKNGEYYVFKNVYSTRGKSTCFYLKEALKRCPLYWTPVYNGDSESSYGYDDNGDIIEVKYLGWWIFGVPKYKPHIFCEMSNDYENEVHIYVSSKIPDEGLRLLEHGILHADKALCDRPKIIPII